MYGRPSRNQAKQGMDALYQEELAASVLEKTNDTQF
jgi:hypothetical protein